MCKKSSTNSLLLLSLFALSAAWILFGISLTRVDPATLAFAGFQPRTAQHAEDLRAWDGQQQYAYERNLKASRPDVLPDSLGALPTILHLPHVTISKRIRYCDQVPARLTRAECVQRARKVARKGRTTTYYKLTYIKAGEMCPSGMHWSATDTFYYKLQVEALAYFKAHPNASYYSRIGPVNLSDDCVKN